MPPQDPFSTKVQRLCWADLATSDAEAGKSFYCQLFGWMPQDRYIGKGRFTLFWDHNTAIASLYQLKRKQIEGGVPSHWTSYVRVPDVDAAASKAVSLGGQVIVPPHDSGEMARICLISDPTGALIGLWQEPTDKDMRSLPRG